MNEIERTSFDEMTNFGEPRRTVFNRRKRRALTAIGRRMERAVAGVKRTHTRAAAQPYIHRYSRLFRTYKDLLGQL